MTSFNVLSRHEKVQRNALLEASAGTGKTFAIENVVVRLLIEDSIHEPLQIEKILVVTFTRAATRDLKARIRLNIENSLHFLRKHLNGTVTKNCPDYLVAKVEEGLEATKKAIKHLERALFNFDQSQIFTIHGFCWRMLRNFAIESGISFESSCHENSPSLTNINLQIVRDFLRTELLPEKYSSEQLRIALKMAKGGIDKLQSLLLREVSKCIEIATTAPFEEQFKEFQSEMSVLRRNHQFSSDKIMADFLLLSPSYKDLCNRSGKIHQQYIDKVQRFAALFDKEVIDKKDFDLLIKEGIFLLEALHDSQLKKKSHLHSCDNLHYPHFLNLIKDSLNSIVNKARSPSAILARMTADCQQYIRRYQREEELLGHNDLLTEMRKAIAEPAFFKKVREAFDAAIIDEFQDTDPVQWEIFASLFINHPWKGYLYLVGDPKQSIYAFRQADIYTYLSAAERLGNDAFSTLDTNFRSQSSLVEALNVIFQNSKNLFSLPQKGIFLPYRPVNPGKNEAQTLNDDGACIQFWGASTEQKKDSKKLETHFFFPAIADELVKLKKCCQINFGQCAILVKDHEQAKRVSKFLNKCRIPVKKQKAAELSKSPALHAMQEVLKGILHYTDESALKIALATRLIGFTHDELVEVTEEKNLIPLLNTCNRLRSILISEGFGIFYSELMQSVWNASGRNVLENMLSQDDGYEFYREWEDIADILIEEQGNRFLSSEELLKFLNDFDNVAREDEEGVKAYVDRDEEGVSILTTHVSKGLEFDIVFALGMMERTKLSADGLIIIKNEQQQLLSPVDSDSDPQYLKFCEEIDAEKMRQLYVAFTRAKYRLYVPVVLGKQNHVSMGNASPIELLLARLDQPAIDYAGLYERINHQNSTPLQPFIDKKLADISFTILKDTEIPQTLLSEDQSPELLCPSSIQIPKSIQTIQSFSSIAKSKEFVRQELSDDVQAPCQFSIELKTPHTLPSGNETGTLLHRMLEIIPFPEAKKARDSSTLFPWILPLIRNTPFASWGTIIADIIFKALNMPLSGSGLCGADFSLRSFCLADVNPKKMYRETEFLYSFTNPSHSEYLKGVIDLMFEHNGKYYLLDWKTNWLGPNSTYYQTEHLQKAMQINQYDLQAKIYVEALRRYLALFDSRPFEMIFGGIYYYFLRGIGTNTGILKLGLGSDL